MGVATIGSFSAAHAYADNGVYTVTATVTDDDGGSDTKTFQVTVNNVAPTLDPLPGVTVDEGVVFQLIATFTDPGYSTSSTSEAFTFHLDRGDGSTTGGTVPVVINGSFDVATSGSVSIPIAFDDSGTYTVTLTITDDDGDSGTETFVVTVNNVAPVASVDGLDLVVRGEPVIYTFSTTDLAVDLVSVDYAVDWDGDGVVDQVASAGAVLELEHIFPDLGDFSISVRVTDKDGGISDLAQLPVTVDVTRVTEDGKVAVGGTGGLDLIEGGSGSLEIIINGGIPIVFTDRAITGLIVYGQGGDDVIIVEPGISLDGGVTLLSTELHGGEGNDTLQGGTGENLLIGGEGDDILVDGGGTNIVIGGSGNNTFIPGGGTNTFESEPGSTTPTVFADTYQVDEGSVLDVAANAGVLANDVAATADALSAVLVSGPTYGSHSLNLDGSFSYTANDGFNGTDSFTYLARNAGGDSTPATVTIAVDNVAPDTVLINDTAISTYVFAVGDSQSFTGSFSDVGILDTHTADWTFSHVVGLSTVAETRPGTLTQGAGSGTISNDFFFSDSGVYTVTLTIIDDDTGVTTSEASMFVVYDPSAGFVTGGGGVDRIRLKIWDKAAGDAIVYDSGLGGSDDDDPSMILGGGKIIIHSKGNALQAAGGAAHDGAALSTLSYATLQPVVNQAIRDWAAEGADATQLDLLSGLDVQIADLSESYLGISSASTNIVWIDANAAGYGWGAPGSSNLLAERPAVV